MEELTGEVSVEITAVGSKSERTSVVLRVDDGGEVVLRTRRPDSLSAEPTLSAYAGQRVRVRGQPGWASFVVDEIEAVTGTEGTGPEVTGPEVTALEEEPDGP